MSPEDIALIRQQLSLTRGMEEAFAAAFYARLFQIAPQLRVLFPHDLSDQGRKLMTVLTFAAGALDRPDALVPAVRMLGARHVTYGVELAHFEPVGAALLHTLAAALGQGFDARAEAAWTAAITALAGLMAEGMAEAKAKLNAA